MKKLIPIILLLGLFSIPVKAAFPDVAENHIYKDAINYVQAQGIVNGYSDGTFRPANSVTRGEFTKIIMGSVFENISGSCTGTYAQEKALYPDVQVNNKFFEYICLAKSTGVITGYSDGNFKPDNNISVGEAAKIIVNALELNDYLYLGQGAGVFEEYLTVLGDKKALPIELLSIDMPLTRGQMAEIVYRVKMNITNKPSTNYGTLNTNVLNISGEKFEINFMNKIEGIDSETLIGVGFDTADNYFVLSKIESEPEFEWYEDKILNIAADNSFYQCSSQGLNRVSTGIEAGKTFYIVRSIVNEPGCEVDDVYFKVYQLNGNSAPYFVITGRGDSPESFSAMFTLK